MHTECCRVDRSSLYNKFQIMKFYFIEHFSLGSERELLMVLSYCCLNCLLLLKWIQILIGLKCCWQKINGVNDILLLISKDHVCSEVKRLIPSTWGVSLIHWLHAQYIFKSFYYASFFDRHWLSHTVNIHFPLHLLEVFMIAIQEGVQELPSALNLISATALCNVCNTF